MTDILECCFRPLNERSPTGTRFFRIIGRDPEGRVVNLLGRFCREAQKNGVYLRGGFSNPTEPETSRFFGAVGAQFTLGRSLLERHMAVWLGQLRPAQRQALSSALMDAIELARRKGLGENVLRNAYIKFMCWLRQPLGKAVAGIGSNTPPKLLVEKGITKHSALLLHALRLAGCDVWYVDFVSDAEYLRADPDGGLSELVRGKIFTPPAVHFADPVSCAGHSSTTRSGKNSMPPHSVTSQTPPSIQGASIGIQESPCVQLNSWLREGMTIWDALLTPGKKRGGGSAGSCVMFAACFGVDERVEYRNRIYRLKNALEASGRRFVLCDKRIQNPTVSEAAPFQALDKNAPRPSVINSIAGRITTSGRQGERVRAAFIRAMSLTPQQSPAWFFSYAVRLACWLDRYTETLFAPDRSGLPPVFVHYGALSAAELTLLWTLAESGTDVLYLSTDKAHEEVFHKHFLPHEWLEVELPNSIPSEPFPKREEKLRASTIAYNASRELDQLLYDDTGLYRARQFTHSQPVTLRTTIDEVWQLWPEESQYRPAFRTENDTAYIPNIFAKICGVDKGDESLFWNRLRGMVTENTWLITNVPFLTDEKPGFTMSEARSLLRGGKLDRRMIKGSCHYRYGYLPDNTQELILDKIQALLDYGMITEGGVEFPAVALSTLLEIDKEILRLLQGFDFTREIPKILIVDVTEEVFTLRECILLAFLNLAGFDIAVFTPTGYRNLESHLGPDVFDTLTVGTFKYGLAVPNLRSRGAVNGLLGRLFRSKM